MTEGNDGEVHLFLPRQPELVQSHPIIHAWEIMNNGIFCAMYNQTGAVVLISERKGIFCSRHNFFSRACLRISGEHNFAFPESCVFPQTILHTTFALLSRREAFEKDFGTFSFSSHDNFHLTHFFIVESDQAMSPTPGKPECTSASPRFRALLYENDSACLTRDIHMKFRLLTVSIVTRSMRNSAENFGVRWQ